MQQAHAVSLAVALMAVLATGAGAQGGTPMGGPQEGYPDGSRWSAGTYEATDGRVKLQQNGVQALSAAGAPSSEAAQAVDAGLPEGLSLKQGTATRIMADEASGPGAAAAPLPESLDREQTGAATGPAAAGGSAEKWFVLYPVDYKGIPVAKYSDVLTVVDDSGAMLYLRKRNLPTSLNATTPTVGPKVAVSAARKHAGSALDAQATASTPALEVWVQPTLEGQISWTFTLSGSSVTDPRVRRYWVSAVGQPRVLHWEDEVYHLHAGAVSAQVFDASPFVPAVNHLLPDLNVTRMPGGAVVPTGLDGRYGYNIGGGLATISGGLQGPFSSIQNLAGAVLSTSASGTPPTSIDLNFGASGEFATAQTTAFYWTNATFQMARSILDPLVVKPFLNLPTKVNIASTCNAFWNGSSINFFRAGGACPNTAYSDVVAHEYGHGIDHWRGGILDGGYSEGFGDAVALLLTRQPCLGRDFTGPNTCLRPATAVDLWPSGSPEVHEVGKRYGQFTWQLVQELKKTYSEEESFRLAQRLVLAAASANPLNIPDAVRLSFIADDTDGNLANGTPHCRQLAAAADSRKIPNPGCPPDRLGYTWANNPTSPSYAPIATYSYNSAGGPIGITHGSAGNYQVRFGGLGGNGSAGGNVQVTPYGSGGVSCRVVSWGSSGVDFLVSVQCLNSAGVATDGLYTVLVNWH
ncbi:MAG TPA: hypothetical protein VH394_16330 [Thermoanaerobaculia bacterium]|nr:hypothetical protein [Thermoanaerobaculia bacterium]